MKNIFFLIIILAFSFSDYSYSLSDNNITSPTYQMNVWAPEYNNHIILSFFSTQG